MSGGVTVVLKNGVVLSIGGLTLVTAAWTRGAWWRRGFAVGAEASAARGESTPSRPENVPERLVATVFHAAPGTTNQVEINRRAGRSEHGLAQGNTCFGAVRANNEWCALKGSDD